MWRVAIQVIAEEVIMSEAEPNIPADAAANAGEHITSVPLLSHRTEVAVRENQIQSCLERFTESFPPPPILATPRPAPPSTAPKAAYRVAVACDLSDLSEGVLREAISFARGHVAGELHLVAVVEKVRSHYILRHDQQRKHLTFDEVKSLMTHLLWKVGIADQSQRENEVLKIGLHVGVGDPATEILRLSHELLVDLIVIGCREHEGLERRIWGSISKTVMSHADCSVVLSRPADFVHGRRIPSIEPPRPWRSEGHHLALHHYYGVRSTRAGAPHVL